LNTFGRININCVSTAGGSTADLYSAGIYCDNKPHSVLVTWGSGALYVYVDGVLLLSDLTCDAPVGLDKLFVSQTQFGACSGPVVVSDIQVFNTSDKSKLKLFY
jgi:hypothetical protein